VTTLGRVLDPVLAIVADVVKRPAFDERELERVKNDRLTALAQQRDNPSQVSADTLGLLVYGGEHRYGLPLLGSEAALGKIGRADVVKWHAQRLGAGAATLIVVGDVQPDAVVRQLDAAFAGWSSAPRPVRLRHPPTALPETTRKVALIDRPGAAQTELRLGLPGPERTSPDYFPLLVANAILGGNFSSRLNTNLRERHAYTYGARTDFAFRRGGGPFTAASPVKTAVTGPALEETLAELGRIREGEVTAEELRLAKDLLTRALARTFETPPDVATALALLITYGLPDDYFATYAARVEAVTAADVLRVVKARIDPAKMPIVLVGDRAQIGAPVEKLLGAYELRDASGRPMPKTADAAPR
jgi:predicted Zn-dependent peptidase